MADNPSPNESPGGQGRSDSASSFPRSMAEARSRVLFHGPPSPQQNKTEQHANDDQDSAMAHQDAEEYNSQSSSNGSSRPKSNDPTSDIRAEEVSTNIDDADNSITAGSAVAPQRKNVTTLSAARTQDLHEALTTDLPGVPSPSPASTCTSNVPIPTAPQTEVQEKDATPENLTPRGGGTSEEEDDPEKTPRQSTQLLVVKISSFVRDPTILSTDDVFLKPLADAMIGNLFRSVRATARATRKAAKAAASAQNSTEVAQEDKEALSEDRGEEEDGEVLDEGFDQDEESDGYDSDDSGDQDPDDEADRGDGEGDERRDQDKGGRGSDQDGEEGQDDDDDEETNSEDSEEYEGEEDQEEKKNTLESTEDGGDTMDITSRDGSSSNQEPPEDQLSPELDATGPTASSESSSGHLPAAPPNSLTSGVQTPSSDVPNGQSSLQGNSPPWPLPIQIDEHVYTDYTESLSSLLSDLDPDIQDLIPEDEPGWVHEPPEETDQEDQEFILQSSSESTTDSSSLSLDSVEKPTSSQDVVEHPSHEPPTPRERRLLERNTNRAITSNTSNSVQTASTSSLETTARPETSPELNESAGSQESTPSDVQNHSIRNELPQDELALDQAPRSDPVQWVSDLIESTPVEQTHHESAESQYAQNQSIEDQFTHEASAQNESAVEESGQGQAGTFQSAQLSTTPKELDPTESTTNSEPSNTPSANSSLSREPSGSGDNDPPSSPTTLKPHLTQDQDSQANKSTDSTTFSQPVGSETVDAPTSDAENDQSSTSSGDVQAAPTTTDLTNIQPQTAVAQGVAPLDSAPQPSSTHVQSHIAGAQGAQPSSSANAPVGTILATTQGPQQVGVLAHVPTTTALTQTYQQTSTAANVPATSGHTSTSAITGTAQGPPPASATATAPTVLGTTQAHQQTNATASTPAAPANTPTSTVTGNTHAAQQGNAPAPGPAPILQHASVYYQPPKPPSSAMSKTSSEAETSGWISNPTNFGNNRRRCPMCIRTNCKGTCSGGPPCDACARLGYSARQCQTGEKGKDGGGRPERPGRKRGKRDGGMGGAELAGRIVA